MMSSRKGSGSCSGRTSQQKYGRNLARDARGVGVADLRGQTWTRWMDDL